MTKHRLLLRLTGLGRRSVGHRRGLSTSQHCFQSQHYKLLVVGGGSGGAATGARFADKLGKGQVAVIEPCESHYYQPMWTLVGAGLSTFEDTRKDMGDVLHKDCTWIRDRAAAFDAENCKVTTEGGTEITYDYLVVALGIQLNYDQVTGLTEALESDPSVCSNYSPKYVKKTFPALQALDGGQAIFTFPNTPIKCAGAPQKIMYLADDYLRKHGKRDQVKIVFNSSLGVIFGVKKYAERLLDVVKDRGIHVNYRTNLIEVKPDKKEAVFVNLDTDKTETFQYSFLHATPPMSTPNCLSSSSLVNSAGYLDVNRETLQHVSHPNIFGLGDCTSVPTSKTAAAVATQSGVLYKNLTAVMDGRQPSSQYDGYTSCPLITKDGACILAEFDFDGQPLETFPFDQGKERRSMYHLKKDMLPIVYWQFMVKGNWHGPSVPRKLLHLGMGR